MVEGNGESPQILSRAAYERLQAELEHLTTEGRKGVAERLLRARELGDLSENAEYDETKNEQGLMEAKIRKLQHIIKNAIVQEGPVSADSVVPGILVTVRDDDGDESTYLFAASPEEKAKGARTITKASPLGAALAGKVVGDKASYEAPAGTFTVEITKLEPWDGK
ncbi:MAG: transcription elongation factor GreA [Actinomycetota bacterium]|nr:transcription elongation factor GreA [Actinomycetota bacterium]